MAQNNKGRVEAAGQGGGPDSCDRCGLVLVYATFPNEQAALDAGRELVESRLAGCVNVFPGMTSVYVWEGTTETAKEAVLIAKTRQTSARAVMAAIKQRHSYAVPAILAVPVIEADADYAAWLLAGTDAPGAI